MTALSPESVPRMLSQTVLEAAFIKTQRVLIGFKVNEYLILVNTGRLDAYKALDEVLYLKDTGPLQDIIAFWMIRAYAYHSTENYDAARKFAEEASILVDRFEREHPKLEPGCPLHIQSARG